METIKLNKEKTLGKTIMIFTEGTIIKHKSLLSLFNYKSYIPIGNCIETILQWQRIGANIVYCTSRRGKKAKDIAGLLTKYGFVGTQLHYRSKGEKYKSIVESIKPDILIEDDCRSIGGAWQMCITNVAPQIKEKIISIVVKEFNGIDEISQKVISIIE